MKFGKRLPIYYMFAPSCGMVSSAATTLWWSPWWSKIFLETTYGSATYWLNALSMGPWCKRGGATSSDHILLVPPFLRGRPWELLSGWALQPCMWAKCLVIQRSYDIGMPQSWLFANLENVKCKDICSYRLLSISKEECVKSGLVLLDLIFEELRLHLPVVSWIPISLWMYCILCIVYIQLNSIALSRLDCSIPSYIAVNPK